MELKLQNIEPSQAHFCLHTCQFLEELGIDLHKKKILIAFSAGLDSTALLAFFALIKDKYSLDLKAIHIHHGIRKEADDDAKHARILAEKLNIDFSLLHEDIPSLSNTWKKGLEETGRIVRYRHFERIKEEENIDFIALGHHLNDLAEDSLMRQIRGTSLEESFGMQAIDHDRSIIRPFLCTEKSRLYNFAKALKIDWVEDSSNNSNDYTRNRIRNTLLPLILEENPNYLSAIANNWRQGLIEKAFWQEELKAFTIENNCLILTDKHSIKRKNFCVQPQALRLRILAMLLKKFGSFPESRLLMKIDSLAMQNESNKKISANNKVIISIHKDSIEFCKVMD